MLLCCCGFVPLGCATNAFQLASLSAASTPLGAVAGRPFSAVAQCVDGVGTPAALSIPSSNAAALGCIDPASSAGGYFAFQPATVAPEYALGQQTLPSPWAASDVTLSFYSSATAGSVTWSLQTACSPVLGGLTVYGSAVSVTTPVSAAASQIVTTATIADIATSGSNGCAPGSPMQYRITRSASDSLAGEAYLVGILLTQRAS
jgi:hypothetical protein